MATLFRKDGYWWINYSSSGKRFRYSTGTMNRKLAEVKLNDLKVKLFKGDVGAKPSAGQRTLISELFRRYIEYLNSNSPVDNHPDLARINAWRNYLARNGVRYISAISPAIVDDFRSTILNGNKPKTIRNYITLLKTILNKAVEWELIDRNPIANVKLPKVVKTFNYFSKEEIDRIIGEAEEPLKTGIQILVNTGMRRGELFHLRWRDVDIKSGYLRVWPYESFSPKGKRPRQIPIVKFLKPILSKIKKRKNPDDYVFRPFSSEHRLYKRFVTHVKKLGLKGTLHDLRHSFASHLAMAGTPIPVIKELLGHSDISTTMIYSHLSPDIHKKEIEKLPFQS